MMLFAWVSIENILFLKTSGNVRKALVILLYALNKQIMAKNPFIFIIKTEALLNFL